MHTELRLNRGQGVAGLAPWSAVSAAEVQSMSAANDWVEVTAAGPGVLDVQRAAGNDFNVYVRSVNPHISFTARDGVLVRPTSGSATLSGSPVEYKVEPETAGSGSEADSLNEEELPGATGPDDQEPSTERGTVTKVPVEVAITTPEGVEIEQGDAYTMSGYVNPSPPFQKRWHIPQILEDVVIIHPETGRITFADRTSEAPIALQLATISLSAGDNDDPRDTYDMTFIPFSRPGITTHLFGPYNVQISEHTHRLLGEKKSVTSYDEGDMGFSYTSLSDKCRGRYSYEHRLLYTVYAYVSVGSHHLDMLAQAGAAAAWRGRHNSDVPFGPDGVQVALNVITSPLAVSLGPVSFTPGYRSGNDATINDSGYAVMKERTFDEHAANIELTDSDYAKIEVGITNEVLASGWAISVVRGEVDHSTHPSSIITFKPRMPIP